MDAEDFAIARIEGQPAKNPSFWIRSVQVEQRYGRTDQFWLPALNHSLAQARIFGATEVVIEYSDYKTNVRDAQARARAGDELHQKKDKAPIVAHTAHLASGLHLIWQRGAWCVLVSNISLCSTNLARDLVFAARLQGRPLQSKASRRTIRTSYLASCFLQHLKNHLLFSVGRLSRRSCVQCNRTRLDGEFGIAT